MEAKKDLKFLIIAMMAWGEGVSGGDRISIELCRRWSLNFPVTVYLWEEGYRMYMRHNLNAEKIKFKIINMRPWKYLGFFINYLARIIAGVAFASRINLENEKTTIVYSATEFWMDSLPGLILKLRFPKITWAATWFQTAPNPLTGFKEGERADAYRFNALVYWLVQLPIKPLIKKWADFVLVNNDMEKKQFEKAIVVLGAVDLQKIKQYKTKFKNPPKIFDAVFQGRFHPQKGVVELIDIWRLVVSKKPDAKLVLVGDGPLMTSVKCKVKSEKLEKNIILNGYLFDGEEKYKIFSQSKVVVHPAFYDSGGMASAEAMALGLPAVGFDLSSYKSYYPRGMLKVPINNLQAFAEAILELLRDKKLYSKIANQAKTMIFKNWSWDKRSEQILSYLK